MKILNHGIDEYLEMAKAFHGHLAPGMICGGFMVDLAFSFLPEGGFYDSICETRACIPDSIQILTPCTVGNGWLRIIDTGRFALVFYNKETGKGVRVWLDQKRLDKWPEFKVWAMKLKPKKDQDKKRLIKEIIEAGTSVYAAAKVVVDLDKTSSTMKKKISLCSKCGESFRHKVHDNNSSMQDSDQLCPGCSGELPFYPEKMEDRPESIEVKDAIGSVLIHDMTKIVPGVSKKVAFQKGHEIRPEDVEELKGMGKSRVYKSGHMPLNDSIHEDEAASKMAEAMSGPNTYFDPEPKEGRVDLKAECNGILVIETGKLTSFNRIEDVMCASLPQYSTVTKGQVIAGTRAVPLYLKRSILDKALSLMGHDGIFSIRKLRRAKAGIIVTGSEVAEGIVKDRFIPIITGILQKYGCEIIQSRICRDDKNEIGLTAKEFAENTDLIVVTGGLSVDPDDVTKPGLEDAGMTDIVYGAPILPGAMTLLGKIGATDVIGVPGGALYSEPAAFDVLLPLVLAGIRLTKADIAQMAAGGLLSTRKRQM